MSKPNTVAGQQRLKAMAVTTFVGLMLSVSAQAQSNGASGAEVPDSLVQEPITVNGGWVDFFWGSGEPTTASPEFTFEGAACVSITDAFCRGDEFDLNDNFALVGSTSEVASDECEGGVEDPDLAYFDPSYSSGSFQLPAGSHLLSIDVTANPFDNGSAFIRVDDSCPDSSARATFRVTKVFTDGNPADVDVTLSCNTGLPLEQTKTINSEEHVTFVVTDFDDGELDCEITESAVAGYSASYDDGTVSAENCSYEDLGYGFGSRQACQITNSPDPVDVVVTKEWLLNGPNAGDVSDDYSITLYCDAEIVGGYDIYESEGADSPDGDVQLGCGLITKGADSPQGFNGYQWCKTMSGSGNGDETFEVIPEYPSSGCYAREIVYDDAIESDSSDCDSLVVSAGSGDSCTIVNTVFFEGIPTLSQYGMAILALLMLGAGLVGFRRLA